MGFKRKTRREVPMGRITALGLLLTLTLLLPSSLGNGCDDDPSGLLIAKGSYRTEYGTEKADFGAVRLMAASMSFPSFERVVGESLGEMRDAALR